MTCLEEHPLFTLVTPTFNRAGHLARAIESVRAQGRSDVEHWVIDGGSTDTTAEVAALHSVRYLSEPDHGIYDALNKGISRATGEIIGLLNSDDLLPHGTLDAVAAAFRDPGIDVVSGGAEIFRVVNGKEERVLIQNNPASIALTPENVLFGVPAINARFFRRRFLQQHLPFDLRYRIAADREMLLRIAVAGARELVLERILCRYCEHEGSLTIRKKVPLREGAGWEHLDLIEHHSRSARPELQLLLQGAHSQESAWLAVKLLAAGHFREALQMARRGCATSKKWPVAAVRIAGCALLEKLGLH